jgi:hypothetical protein
VSAEGAVEEMGRPRISGQAEPRDVTIDILRGFFICVVVVDHVNSFPSLFGYISGMGRLFSSTAEGFMLVSGFLVGRIRGREAAAGRLDLASRRLLLRATTLALWTAIVTLILHVTAVATGYAPIDCGELRAGGPLASVFSAVTLRYVYGHQLFLALYAIFLAAAPLVIWALVRGRTVIVVAVSMGIWLVGLVTPGEPAWTQRYESELSWQFLFYIGVVIGFHADTLRARAHELSPPMLRLLYRGAIAFSIATVALSWLYMGERIPVIKHLFKRDEIGPGRMLCGLLWTGTLYAVVKRHERFVVDAVGRFFLPLGRHTLYIFIVHAPIAYYLCGHRVHGFVAATFVDAVALTFVWLLVRHRVLFSIIPS